MNFKHLALFALIIPGFFGTAFGHTVDSMSSQMIQEIQSIDLDESEQKLFKISAQTIRNNIQSV